MLRAISICSKHLAVQFPVITELGRGSEPANHIETWLTLCENWLCVERLWDGMTGADCILAFFRMVKQQLFLVAYLPLGYPARNATSQKQLDILLV